MLSSGETTGLFQLESSGVRSALRQMKPNQFEGYYCISSFV